MGKVWRPTFTSLMVAVAIHTVAVHQVARACCPASKLGSPVRIADQRILIVWDPETRTEHFIRSAGFRAAAPSGEAASADAFGFLVPSPTEPEVATADESVFPALDDLIRPRIEEVDRWRPDPTPLVLMPFRLANPAMRGLAAPATTSDVRVLQQKRVGQYDVAVLEADDATALTDWLATNGFESRPALREWAEPYVAKGWIITAFRYAGGAGRIETGGVRMSFQTDIPMFAYRVPTDNLAGAPVGEGSDGAASAGGARPALLRAFVVIPGRANGTLGEGEGAHGWSQAQCRYSRPIAAETFAALIGRSLPEHAMNPPANLWLTAFDDPTWPSGTEDLRFTHEAGGTEYQEVVRRVNQRTIPVPLDVLGLGVAAAIWGLRRQFA
ncbi:MAG: DUF2330 domain-containing protein [Planctomycetia bacterium]|nr:DUF2330 domain-containing protein [Planctomycetia bacterium]